MRDVTRIRQVMELLNTETDPQKIKILVRELAHLLREKCPPISVRTRRSYSISPEPPALHLTAHPQPPS